jgi:hypothetical protein
MRKLIIQQNQVNYVGLFSKPAFSLWGNGARILEELYKAFSPYKVSLADFRQDYLSPVISDTSVTVFLGSNGNYKFKFDRVEVLLSNFTEQELTNFPDVLLRGTDWLRSDIPDFSFQTHLFTYHNHSKLSEGTAKEFLLSFSQVSLGDIGMGIGNGLIFNWIEPKQERRVQLTIDHSYAYVDALFIQFLMQSGGDKIDYWETAATGRELLDNALAKIGLEIKKED